jgi:hypothetical protein
VFSKPKIELNISCAVITTEEGVIAKTKYYSGITAVEVIERPNQSIQFMTYIAGSPYDAAVALKKTYTISGGNYAPSTQVCCIPKIRQNYH